LVVSKGKVVKIDYVMNDPFGKMIESSEQEGPLEYLHGFGNMLPGVEKKLDGAKIGEQFKIVVPPENGYGKMDDTLIETFPLETFDFADTPAVGMEIVLETEEGEEMPAVIEHISDQEITLNANHQLAGIVLHFEVTVLDVRDATAEELEFGQPIIDEHSEHHH
jgi:FKBP-type peptidyl-prolyl cis-trans isomerase SlyD